MLYVCFMIGGHHAYCESDLVSDIVGFVVHSCLLVPFFSWQISHKRHHSNTGNVDRDEVFVPRVATDKDEDHHFAVLQPNFLARLGHITVMLTLGWFLYLGINATGTFFF